MKMIKRIFLTYNHLSIEKKSALWITLCSIIQKGISFLTVPIFTRIMPQFDYGVYQVYQSWISFLLIFTSLNLASGCFNNAMLIFENQQEQYLSSIQSLITCTTLFLAGVLFLLYPVLSSLMQLSPLILVIMFVELFFEPAYLLWAAKKRFDFTYKSLVLITLGMAIIVPVGSILFVTLSADKATAKIAASAGCACVIYFIIYITNFRKGKTFFRKDFWKFALGFNIPLLPHYLSMTVLSQADRIMINNMCGSEQAAIYSIATNVSLVLVIVVNAFNSALIPWQYRKLKNNNVIPIRYTMNFIIVAAAIVTSIPIILAPEIVKILAPYNYYEAIWSIPPIAASTFFILLYSMCCNIELYYEKKYMVMIASLCAAVLNIVTNYVFIKKYGYIAAGYTTVLSYFFLALFHCIFMRYISKCHHIEEVYNFKIIFAATLLMCLLSVVSMFLYNFTIIRYLLLSVSVVVLIIKRKNVLRFLYKIKKA